MIRMPWRKGSAAALVVAASCLVLAASACFAQEEGERPGLFSQPDFPYTGQGPFVIGPARFLSSPVFGVGFMAGALVCAPISLVQDPRMEGNVPREKQASIVCGRGLGTALGWPVYAAVGLPFFILKGLFWDAPRALAGAVSRK